MAQEAEAPEEARSLAEIEKEAKLALSRKNFGRLGLLIEEAAALGEPEAYRTLISWVRGEDPKLDTAAFNVLSQAEDPACRAVIYQETLRNPNFKTRIVLLGVVNKLREDPAAFAVLGQALRDPARPVVLTAVKRLRESKDPPRAVPPLIEALQVHERSNRGRLVHDIRNALQALTGAELGPAADWRNYWEAQKAGVKPRAAGSTRALPPKSQFFQMPIESDRLIFIIDLSGSMEKRDPPLPEKKKEAPPPEPSDGRTVARKQTKTEAVKGKETKEGKQEKGAAPDGEEDVDEELPIERERLYRVKKELVRSIEALPENVHFTVQWYNNEVAFLDEPPRLIPASPQNRKRAADWVKAMEAKGETWTDTALERALSEVRDVDTVYLLTDGMPYRNGSSLNKTQVRQKVKALNRFLKCRINTIGFLQAGDNLRQFLHELARENDGTFLPLR